MPVAERANDWEISRVAGGVKAVGQYGGRQVIVECSPSGFNVRAEGSANSAPVGVPMEVVFRALRALGYSVIYQPRGASSVA